ncbi:MAG: ABC transporter ATP-binding protein [Dongiaceae bacterium]
MQGSLDRATTAQDRQPLVRLRGISKRFGDVWAVHPLDLDIHEGEFLALLGPSGCGKTTLLRLIGGFIEPSGGHIDIAGRDVTRLGPERRKTNMVFQSYALFPHMTVRQNIGYGLRIAGKPQPEIDAKVNQLIDLVHLGGLADRLPKNLSGGQQQRVALARALAMEPAVLLLDESLAALDLQLRKAMQDELRALHRALGGTFVFVTHDQGEAMALANRIVVLQDGRIVQDGSPHDIYTAPTTEFVAGFIGEANIFEGERRSGTVVLANGAKFADTGGDGRVVVVVRPDSMTLAAAPSGGEASMTGRIEDVTFLGTHFRVAIRLDSGESVFSHRDAAAPGTDLAVGTRVHVGWQKDGRRVVEAA